MRTTGVAARGIRAPIIKKGDNLADIVVDSVLEAAKQENIILKDRDVVGVTEAVLARAQGNYATVEQIAADVKQKFPQGEVGLIFPILSRNRFSMLLRGISMGVQKLYIMLSYPQDEVGNPLVSQDILDEHRIGSKSQSFTEEQFRKIVGDVKHPFTGVDYLQYYKDICACPCEIILSNSIKHILGYTTQVINADVHTRKRTKNILYGSGATKVVSLDEILCESVDGSGFQPEYGILGSNLATDASVKLFPRDAQIFVDELYKKFYQKTGKRIECLIYGDGAFKDPVGGIWELADPVVSPGFTAGLSGTPNEIKLKYIADNKIADLSGQQAVDAMKNIIKNKDGDLNGKSDMTTQGTTPRRFTDLLGSLCDLVSGSGDKGTPIVLIQGYFDTFAD